MDEVPMEDQAVLKLKLHEEVRNLIREELKAALEDGIFMNTVDGTNILTNASNYYVFRREVAIALKAIFSSAGY